MAKNHKADSFDSGRAASILPDYDPVSIFELSRFKRPGSNEPPSDEDVRALLLAVMSLASPDASPGD